MRHPYAELIGLRFDERSPGYSRCSIEIEHKHLNPNGVAHGAVLYALADTGMGAALHTELAPGQACATIQIAMYYLRPVAPGGVVCTTRVVRRGKSVAHLESRLHVGDALVATASGSYSIFARRQKGT